MEDLCPSSPASEGAILLGVVQPDGSLAYIGSKLVIGHQFSDGDADRRFRFASSCLGNGCEQWANGECTIPGRLQELALPPQEGARLPRCSIRHQCRWFRQAGAAACAICPMVVRQ
jgi:hypothetical protein